MHGSDGVLKSGVQGPRINQMRETHLLDIAQPLKITVFYQVKNQVGWNGHKAINGIVNYFLFIQHGNVNMMTSVFSTGEFLN